MITKYLLTMRLNIFLVTSIFAQASGEKYIVNCTNQEYSNAGMTFDISITNNRFRGVRAWISGGEIDENGNWEVYPLIVNDSIKLAFQYELVDKSRGKSIAKPIIVSSSSDRKKGLKIRGRKSRTVKAKVVVEGNLDEMEYLQFFVAIRGKKDVYVIKSIEFNFKYLKFIYA